MESTINDKYESVIGLEVHAQLQLNRKMFAPEAATYGGLPNTQTSATSLAHPGSLPRINRGAIEQAIKMGIACSSKITRINHFARKNYFYPDLTKGYQITQDKTPVCQGGQITIDTEDGIHKILLERIHLEEDTGKSVYGMLKDQSLLDFNRAGTALIEIVTKPVIRSSQEAYQFIAELRRIVRYLEICDGNMEEGSLRCDANVSVMEKGAKTLGQRVEVKNMNSMRHVQLAIEHEITRHIQLLEKGQKVLQETRTYDAVTSTTRNIRNKESADDYRYFPEPDLPPFIVDQNWIESIRNQMPLLPRDYYQKFMDTYGLSHYDAKVLVEDRDTAVFFDKICKKTTHYKSAVNWIMGPIRSYLNANTISDFPLSTPTLIQLIELVNTGEINFSSAAQNLFPVLIEKPDSNPKQLAIELGLVHSQDELQVIGIIKKIMSKYPDKVSAYRCGKTGIFSMLMGEIMKTSKVSPKLATRLLKQALENNK